MKKFVFFLTLICSVFSLHAQEPAEICGYQTEVNRLIQKQPNFLALQNAWMKQALESLEAEQNSKRNITADTLYLEIPVVFHVLYNNTAQNISSNLLINQLEEINNAFRKMNADTTRIRPIFKPLAADVKIQFVLATTDPNGLPTTGINRYNTSRTTFALSQAGNYSTDMKHSNKGGADAWNPTRYLNIWICNMAYPNYYAITYGFATPPTGAPNWNSSITKDSTDDESGVVLHYTITGRNNPLAPSKYSEGKAAIHEVGHYLGLRHVWGDGNSSTGCSVDDGIFDTPNARLSNSTCSGQNSCTDASNDKPDMTENYMDYALDGCAAMFTIQQAYIMRYVLDNFRSGLPRREITYDTSHYVENEIKIDIFPNPAGNGVCHVMIGGPKQSKYTFTLVDAVGQTIFDTALSGQSSYTFSTETLGHAFYYILIKDMNGKWITREILIVQ